MFGVAVDTRIHLQNTMARILVFEKGPLARRHYAGMRAYRFRISRFRTNQKYQSRDLSRSNVFRVANTSDDPNPR